MNTQPNLRESREWWNSTETVGYFSEKPADPRIRARLERIPREERENMAALDLGSGSGRHTEMLVQMGFPTYACDVHEEMIRATAARVAALHGPGTAEKVSFGSITNTLYTDGFFGVVIAAGVLHQALSLEEYRQAFQELSRITAPGTIVLLNVFIDTVMDPSYEPVGLEKKTVRTKEGTIMTLLSKEEFYQGMDQAGFQLEEELSSETKQENTGPRTVLRAHFVKK
jgi:SAM-dependent methyltransferase